MNNNTTSETKTIWALLDDRAGNSSQTIGLVNNLIYYLNNKQQQSDNKRYFKEIVQVGYNYLAKLPNFMLGASKTSIDKKYTVSITEPWPDIVVAAGRRLAPIAKYVKQQNPACKLIHIMKPDCNFTDFDAVILPKHDSISNREREAGNIITSTGSLNPITTEKLDEAAHMWAPHLSHVKGRRIAVIIGGDSKAGNMKSRHIKQLFTQLQTMLNEDNNISLLITTSRRTSPAATAEIKKQLTSGKFTNTPHHLYEYKQGGKNPYLAYLALADTIIVTGESVSMSSEACFTAKPVYIYENKAFMSNKHREYIKTLYDMEAAKPLAEYDPKWKGGQKLDEASRIAQIIAEKIEI